MKRFNKFVSLVLILLIIGISVIQNTTFTSVAAPITTAYIEGTDVRVRKGPSTNHTIIEQISYRNATVLSEVKEGDYTWYQITYHNGTEQITGYIRNAEYIRIVTYNPDATFEEKLKAFPESYHEALRQLKAVYKNWEFIPDPVNMTFEQAVALESVDMKKQVSFKSQPVSWRSMGQGSYDWNKNQWVVTNGGWTGASREIVAYYMDPRNFLNTSEIYQFLQQGYNPNYQTEAGVNAIINGTFLATNYVDPKDDPKYGGSYVKVIMEAAKQSGVSPYILASKIRQEIGVNATAMVSGETEGYKGYYNFYNIGASGSDAATTLKNGLERAKSEGWDTRSKAIISGAKFLSNNYIVKGQDTYYYQDFNVHNPDSLWHQYAQAIHDAVAKGKLLAESYIRETNFPLTFRIPIFLNMPPSVSAKPVSNENKNNYYFAAISAPGLTPSYLINNYKYDLKIAGNTTIAVQPVADATYTGKLSYPIKKGLNAIPLTVKAQTGYISTYYINIDSSVDCTVTINVSKIQNSDIPNDTSSTGSSNSLSGTSSSTSSNVSSNPSSATPNSVIVKGDTNGDGKITLSDLANIRLHLLGKFVLKDNNSLGADTNKDGKISLNDLANIRLHLLGLYTIK